MKIPIGFSSGGENLPSFESQSDKKEEKKEKTCPNCGKYMPTENNFCGFCGKKFEKIEYGKKKTKIAGFLGELEESEESGDGESPYSGGKYQSGFLGDIPRTEYFKGCDSLKDLEKRQEELDAKLREKYLKKIEKFPEKAKSLRDEFDEKNYSIMEEYNYRKFIFEKRERKN